MRFGYVDIGLLGRIVMPKESVIPSALREVMLDEMYGKKIASFEFGGDIYDVRRTIGAYLDGGIYGYLQIVNGRSQLYAGIMVDPWEETDEKIVVCSRYEQPLDIMQWAKKLEEEEKDPNLEFFLRLAHPIRFELPVAENVDRTVEEHLDVVGRSILEVVDQSPKPMYWYTFGHPVGMRKERPNEAYERLMTAVAQPGHPLQNRIKVFVDEESEDNWQRNYFYVVEKYFI